jgi:hypothetical protein
MCLKHVIFFLEIATQDLHICLWKEDYKLLLLNFLQFATETLFLGKIS